MPSQSTVTLPATERFWSKVGVVLSGTVAAQAIPLVGSLVIARLVAPEAFGAFATWLGVCTTAAVVATGRYEQALAVERDGAPRRAGVAATLMVVAAVGAALGVACLVAWWWRPAWLDRVSPGLLVSIVPAAMGIAATQTWQSWAAAEGRYAALSSIRIAQAAGITGSQIAAAWVEPSAASLGWGQVIGLGCGLAVAAWRLPLRPWPGAAEITAFLRAHRRFPRWSLPADAINAAASNLPVIIVASRFGGEVAGLLALALRTLGAPIAMLGSAVLDVFKRRASVAYRERGECRAEYADTLRVLAPAGAATAVVFVAAGESLFALAFGEAWRGAGTVALWLAPLFALRFVASPLSYTVYIAGKQAIDLAWQCGLLALTLATLSWPHTYRAALLSYAAAYSAMYVVYLALSYRFAKGPAR